MHSEFDELIDELRCWNNGTGIGVLEWLSGIGSFEQAVAYAALFWPEFLEHDGCVFVRYVSDVDYQRWLLVLGGDKTKVEELINHFHIEDMFKNVPVPPSDKQAVFIGNKMREMLESKLARDFPERQFIVQLSEDKGVVNTSYSLTFFQDRVA